MSPEDIAVVAESWAEIRFRRAALIDRLAESYRAGGCVKAVESRAQWLVDAVGEVVDLLACPSQLADRARELAVARPDPGSAPTFLVDGNAWMISVSEVCPHWTNESDHAWRQAWLLLSEVLAVESLSPFARQPPGSPPGAPLPSDR